MNDVIIVETDHKSVEENFKKLPLQDFGLSNNDYEAVLTQLNNIQVNSESIGNFGGNLGSKGSNQTDQLLDLINNKKLEEQTSLKLNEVVKVAGEINAKNILNPKKNSGLIKTLINKVRGVGESLADPFNTTKEKIDKLILEVEQSQIGLKQRIVMLDSMRKQSELDHKQLGIFIAAGQLKLSEIQEKISRLADNNLDGSKSNEIYEINNHANNLNKRIEDLKLLQYNMSQTIPMIGLIENNNRMIVDKFDAVKNVTIPAWKNQFSMAIALVEQRNAVQLATVIDETTNNILRENAKLLRQNSVETAQASQRGVIEVDTLEFVQNELISTVNDVIKIQKDGAVERVAAEKRLRKLRQDFSNTVLTGIEYKSKN
jgi:uncharacterized protein YaaN involved in tellurite resistance